jgi:hypothetical protein
MARSNLRIYHGPDESGCATLTETRTGKRCVTLPAGHLMPLLADAVNNQRTWVGDFADDEITISTDLYEVLLAYQYYQRPSA